jgi:fluoride exporter
MSPLSEMLAVCVAGGVGTGLRYLIARWMVGAAGTGLPWGTLTVNAVGSAIGGALLNLALTSPHVTPAQRVVLTTGFLGGFTTYSAFNSETLAYLHNGSYGLAASYLLLTVVGCLGAGALGLAAATLIAGR